MHPTSAQSLAGRRPSSLVSMGTAVVEPVERGPLSKRRERYGVDGGGLKNMQEKCFRLRRRLMGRRG